MSEFYQAALLGIVQGLTEFLPISSSAHLVLVPYFTGWKDPGLAFDVALHLGTLAAVLGYYWKDWLQTTFQFFGKNTGEDTVHWKWLVVGTIPAVIAGLFLEEYAENTFRNPLLIALTLSLFAVVLFLCDRWGSQKNNISKLQLTTALMVGCGQALAIVPGVSRSGITISVALALGFSRMASLRFSFLLSAPIIAGAGVLKSKYILAALVSGGSQAQAVYMGFCTSFLSGIFAVWILSQLVRSRTFTVFVVYRLVLATIIILVVGHA